MKNTWIQGVAYMALVASHTVFSLNYESYLESWDSQWESVVTGLPPPTGGEADASYQDMSLNISFACYSFPGLNGLQFPDTDADVETVRAYVDGHDGRARISFGGASYAPPCAPNYFISQTTGWPDNYQELADGVVNVVADYNLSGVDFDIEDPQPSSSGPEEFADQLIVFLQAVRAGLPDEATLSITIPAQGWGTYWYYLATKAAAIDGLVNYISFMEYDIWINPDVGYVGQIEADIITYTSDPSESPPPNWSAGWGIPPRLINLGLMPGCDDNGQYLSVDDAATLTDYAFDEGLFGVMTWDLNRDSGLVQSPSCEVYPQNYEYSTAIRDASNKARGAGDSDAEPVYSETKKQSRGRVIQVFERQLPPSNGSP